jgi:hypothetical protein
LHLTFSEQVLDLFLGLVVGGSLLFLFVLVLLLALPVRFGAEEDELLAQIQFFFVGVDLRFLYLQLLVRPLLLSLL